MSLPSSNPIRQAFDRARDYDAHAGPQAATAMRLAGLVAEFGARRGGRVLDMGCGTGALALALAAWLAPSAAYVCADLSPGMLLRARARLADALAAPRQADPMRVASAVGAATRAASPVSMASAALHPRALPPLAAASPEHPPREGSSPTASQASAPLLAAMDASAPALKPGFEVIASNMALHWTPDPAAALAALWELLAPGGLLAVAMPGLETFRVWREAHEALGLSSGLRRFPTPETFAGFFPAPVQVRQEVHSLRLERAIELPRHLKAVGGFVPRPGHAPLSPAEFRAVLAWLDARPGRLDTGYQVLYGLAAKP